MRPQCIGRTFCVRRAPYRIDCNCPHKQLPAPKAATRTRKTNGKHAYHGGTLHLQGMQCTMGFVHNLGSHASIDITSLCQNQHDPKHLPQSQDPACASRAYCRTCIARPPWPSWRNSLYTSMTCSIMALSSCHPLFLTSNGALVVRYEGWRPHDVPLLSGIRPMPHRQCILHPQLWVLRHHELEMCILQGQALLGPAPRPLSLPLLLSFSVCMPKNATSHEVPLLSRYDDSPQLGLRSSQSRILI